MSVLITIVHVFVCLFLIIVVLLQSGKSGDIVLAVNGYRLSNDSERATCASKADCNVGSAVTYMVQRGNATKSLKFTLAKMPANANARFASRRANFDPALAAAVIPTSN